MRWCVWTFHVTKLPSCATPAAHRRLVLSITRAPERHKWLAHCGEASLDITRAPARHRWLANWTEASLDTTRAPTTYGGLLTEVMLLLGFTGNLQPSGSSFG